MSSCEKCWRDAGGDPHRYADLLARRAEEPCTPEEQAGPDATECPSCKRRVLHQYTGECMARCPAAAVEALTPEPEPR